MVLRSDVAYFSLTYKVNEEKNVWGTTENRIQFKMNKAADLLLTLSPNYQDQFVWPKITNKQC